MTRKHFEAFAEQIAEDKKYGNMTDKEMQRVTDIVSVVAKRFNPMFNKERFLARIEKLSQ